MGSERSGWFSFLFSFGSIKPSQQHRCGGPAGTDPPGFSGRVQGIGHIDLLAEHAFGEVLVKGIAAEFAVIGAGAIDGGSLDAEVLVCPAAVTGELSQIIDKPGGIGADAGADVAVLDICQDAAADVDALQGGASGERGLVVDAPGREELRPVHCPCKMFFFTEQLILLHQRIGQGRNAFRIIRLPDIDGAGKGAAGVDEFLIVAAAGLPEAPGQPVIRRILPAAFRHSQQSEGACAGAGALQCNSLPFRIPVQAKVLFPFPQLRQDPQTLFKVRFPGRMLR